MEYSITKNFASYSTVRCIRAVEETDYCFNVLPESCRDILRHLRSAEVSLFRYFRDLSDLPSKAPSRKFTITSPCCIFDNQNKVNLRLVVPS